MCATRALCFARRFLKCMCFSTVRGTWVSGTVMTPFYSSLESNFGRGGSAKCARSQDLKMRIFKKGSNGRRKDATPRLQAEECPRTSSERIWPTSIVAGCAATATTNSASATKNFMVYFWHAMHEQRERWNVLFVFSARCDHIHPFSSPLYRRPRPLHHASVSFPPFVARLEHDNVLARVHCF